jgi:enoyl-CoA hydratase/carnithine racemase
MADKLDNPAGEPHLLVTDEDGILIATLNRPAKLNAMTVEMMDLFWEALRRFRDTPELKVMLIRATGRYFCSGVDLRQGEPAQAGRSASAIRAFSRVKMRRMHDLYDEMEHIEKPIVAAHHATCMGGGLELSLSCDFRLAAASASYRFPEGSFGVLPASNGVSRLTRICGTHWARYLVMANQPADAQRALIMGMVHEVYPDESFEDQVMAFCRRLAQQNAELMGAAKIAIEMCRDLGREEGRNVERLANSALMLNPDHGAVFRKHVDGIGTARD